MGGLPFKAFVFSSMIGTYLLHKIRPQYLLLNNATFLGTFSRLFAILFLVWTTWEVVLYPKLFSPLRHLPGPTGESWWRGHTTLTAKEVSGGPMIDWVNNIANTGIIRYLGIFNWEHLLITSPKGLSEVLNSKCTDFKKPAHFTAGLGRIVGIGILLAEGDEHKTQRKNLLPAFAFRHIKDLYPMFWHKAKEMIDALTEEVQRSVKEKGRQGAWDTEFEIGNWSSRVTLDIIGIAAMGRDFGSVKNPNAELSVTYKKVLKPSKQAIILGMMTLVFPTWFVHMLPLKRNGEEDDAAKIIRNTCQDSISTKKGKMLRNEVLDTDILNVALESGHFTDDNLADQIMTMLVAGHETVATSMIWAIYLLSLHPDMQTRLRAEIRENLPSLEKEEAVTSQQIDSLMYLNAVCNEVLRYYPPVPLIPRVAAKDTSILGTFVPQGTRVMLCPWATNRDTTLWGADAAVFNPERWMPSISNPNAASGGAASNYSFLTFLHGPRSCIGQGFAKAEFAVLLATWIGRLEFALKNESDRDEANVFNKSGVTAKPANGLWVKARIVEGW